MTTALEISNLVFCRGDRKVLHGIDCTLDEGESLVILGANGAGKSTLLKLIIGSVTNNSGLIKLFGRDIKALRQLEIARMVAYVAQELPQEVRFSVRDFVMLGRYCFQAPLASNSVQDQRKVDEVLAICGCTEFSNRKFDDLSSGERQRVMIATSLAQEARLLLLDEPTSFLDIRQQSEVLELLKGISQDLKMGLICVTHDVNVATYLGGRVLVLSEGRRTFLGNVDEWLNPENLRATYGRDFEVLRCAESKRVIVVPK